MLVCLRQCNEEMTSQSVEGSLVFVSRVFTYAARSLTWTRFGLVLFSAKGAYSSDDVDAKMGLSPTAASLLTLTENKSATFSSSRDSYGNDFCFQIVFDTPASNVASLLELAWKQDALTALKHVFHLRGVHGSGKSIQLAFCSSFVLSRA
ncbi:hypothetical protein L7F22_054695 [Adiantum nelumboides]|nr:hypothetical protein [Adiantum nelumboides]